jgi:PAS domain S-box-containing protein
MTRHLPLHTTRKRAVAGKRLSKPKGRRESARENPAGVLVLELLRPEELTTARILDSNRAAERLLELSREDLAGKRLTAIPDFARPGVLERCGSALRSGETVDVERTAAGGRAKGCGGLRARWLPLSPVRVVVMLEDSTAQAAAEQAVRRSEQGFHLLIHSVKDYAIYMLDPRGNILSWNEGAERLKGYSSDEVIGKKYDIFFTREDRKAGKPGARLREAARTGQAEDEGWLVRKDGWAFWANTLITTLRDEQGRVYGFAQITRDMTERREREESIRVLNEHLEGRIEARTVELVRLNEALQSEVRERKNAEEQLRALAARQEQVREDERTRLAREIHDALGQMCTALKMDIAWIAKRLPKDQRHLMDKSDAALKLVSELIRSLRKISTELRPSTLDALGLVASIEWQAQQFQAHTGIRCQLHLPEKDLVLDKELSTAIFRIFQETLTNVARHAGATKVETSLVVGDTQIALLTHDNGVGFDPSAGEHRQGSLGLLGMKERAHLLGGDFKIKSLPRQGTTVAVHIPLARS